MYRSVKNLVRDLSLEITYVNGRIVQATIFNQLLPVTAHDALRWGVAVGVEDRWGAQQWDVWSVEVTSIQNA